MGSWEEQHLREMVAELREANLLTAARRGEVEQLLDSQQEMRAVDVISSELGLPVHRTEC